jgi:ketopantoate hydroxymethyltransferase
MAFRAKEIVVPVSRPPSAIGAFLVVLEEALAKVHHARTRWLSMPLICLLLKYS